MQNRTLVFLTSLVLLAITALFASHLAPYLWTSTVDKYLAPNDVRGMALVYNTTPYTLNFDQQNRVISAINDSVIASPEILSKGKQPADFEKIIIYRFGASNLILFPIGYVDNGLVYKVAEWNNDNLLYDISNGQLQAVLKESHDP